MTMIAAFAASLFTTVSITSTAMASPGLPGNGPELTGVPEFVEEATFILGIGSCAPWECGVNGPELTGVEIRSHAGGQRVEDLESVEPDSAQF